MKAIIDFLSDIYSKQCQDGDYVILSVKGDTWKDVPIKYQRDNFSDKMVEFLQRYPTSDFDIYWSPMPYSGPKRRLENALETKFLAQDIDEYDDPTKLDPQPSYIWESSPNKYQGLWELDRYIPDEEYTPLNKSLAHHIGCDDCFDFTHVYRVPGTRNHKYKNKPLVKMPEVTNKIYKPRVIKKLVNHEEKKPVKEKAEPSSLTERKIYAKYSIPQKVRDLLAIDDLTGIDRSGTIWYIENKLYELGMTPNEIIHLVRNSAFNKYKGRNDEVKRLKQELDKIISGDISPKESNSPQLKVSSFQDVMGNHNTFEGWLVKGFWGRRSHGIVAGMPKSFKSTLVHDLVVSVASGEPFLGKYPVEEPGPVIVVQNENADYMIKDRTEKLIMHRGLHGEVKVNSKDQVNLEFPDELPIHFINQQGFNMSNPEHCQMLEKLIKDTRPVLVVLDPLYLMFEGDLSSAQDLNPILTWLLHLKNEYKTSIMVVHHYNKGGTGATKGGSRMMGSIMLYGWVESAWYLLKDEAESENKGNENTSSQEPATVTLSREFRMAGHFPDLDIHLSLGEIGDPTYSVDVTLAGEGKPVSRGTLKDEILNTLSTTNKPLSRGELAERTASTRSKVREAIDELIQDKKVAVRDGGFAIY